MRPDELITAIEIPEVEGEQWFRKVGTRAAQAISKVVMAAVRGPEIRIAMGSVAPTVVRLSGTERSLARGDSVDDATRALRDESQPIGDIRSPAEYRLRVCAALSVSGGGKARVDVRARRLSPTYYVSKNS